MRLLLVDDDAAFRKTLSLPLQAEDVRVDEAADGAQALEILTSNPRGAFDLILLDVDMPAKNGWEMLDDVRERGDDVPVIFVTGREKSEDMVHGLKLGADDYIVKPVVFDELKARLEAVLRRREALPSVHFGEIELDLARRKVSRDGNRVDLSPKEFDLLYALIKAGGEVISREALLRDVWDIDFDPGTNILDVHIGRVRKKLDRHGRPAIQTVRGEGYRMARHDDDGSES